MNNSTEMTLKEELQDILTKLTVRNILFYLTGMVVIGIGVSLMLRSSVGLSSWDTLHYAIHALEPKIAFGFATAITASTMMVLTVLLYKKGSYFIMLIPILSVALIINFFNGVVFDGVFVGETETVKNILFYIGGLFLLPFGGSLMIITLLPAAVYDQFMLAVCQKLKTDNIALIRAIIEITIVLTAWLVGTIAGIGLGEIKIGTLIFSVSIGALIKMYLKLFERIGIYEFKQND